MKSNINIKNIFLSAFVLLFLFSCKNNVKEISINACYSKTKSSVFYLNTDSLGITDKIELENVNPVNFKILKNENPENSCVNADIWAQDNLSVFYKYFKLKAADPKKFKILSHGYSTDGKNVWFREKQISNVDIKEFKVIGDFFAADNKTIWFKGQKTKGISDIKHFEIIDGFFAKDTSNIYLISDTIFFKTHNTNIKYFKQATFENSDNFPEMKFYTDSNKVFIFENGLTTPNGYRFIFFDTKPEDFVVYKEKNFFSDGKNIFYGKFILPKTDVKTFEVLGNKYSKDANNVYHKNKIISKETKSFELIQNQLFDAKDKMYKFKSGKIIQ